MNYKTTLDLQYPAIITQPFMQNLQENPTAIEEALYTQHKWGSSSADD